MEHMVNSKITIEPTRITYKITLLGDGGVGKTSLKKQYLGEGFSNDYISTLGADFTVRRFGSNNQNAIQIWDLAGQPKFSSVRKSYYVGTGGAVLIFDLTRPETLLSIPNWIEELMSHRRSTKKLPLVLVGNKKDLQIDENIESVHKSSGEEYADKLTKFSHLDVPYMETSAKTGLNVGTMFEGLINKINLIETAT